MRRTNTRKFLTTIILAVAANSAGATVLWSQGFETDTAGWFDENNGWAGTATRVASGGGVLGVASSSGTHHAEFAQTTGPFSRFDGYRDTWPGSYRASIDIFLDTGWDAGSGFDYAVASNGSDGSHQRDFIFHVTKDTSTGDLLVGGSNNTNFVPREDLETHNNAVITTSGWHTFEHLFYESAGTLAVDLILSDAGGTELFRETRNNALDTIPAEVGGNRYAWFTNIDIDNGIAVDNHQLALAAVPEPGTIALLGLGLAGLSLSRRRSRL